MDPRMDRQMDRRADQRGSGAGAFLMCGLVGLFDRQGLDLAAAKPRLTRALDRLAPRGPDGEGRWHDRHCLLGHRRLAIVDLSDAGALPMTRDGLTLVFNGMIYNYRQLRDQLRSAGHSFSSDCDSEVLLEGWRAWGAALLPKLVGMFAFAIWDAPKRTLFLARDRYGKKPLCYRHTTRGLAFASDLRALQYMDGNGGQIDPAAVSLLFSLRYIPAPWSILEGVRKLPPGHLIRCSPSGFEERRWYDLATAPDYPYADEEEAAGDLRERVEAAVRDRLVADVPLGAFLSGGIDSAIVAACMADAAPEVKTFTVGFEGAADYYEERPGARRVAEHLGTTHTEIPVAASDAGEALDAVFTGLDEPFADSSAVPTYLVARETRRHVTVALSGDGADEVFGGYRKYQGELRAERYRAIPGFLRAALIEPLVRLLPESKSSGPLEKARRLRRFAAHAGKPAAARQAGWLQLLSPEALAQLMVDKPTGPTVEDLVEERRREARTEDAVNRMLHADIVTGLPDDMLVKVDRMSMANALEVRCPFLDHRVVEAATAMPGAYKLKPGSGKHILRRAFSDRLPAEVFERPKKGFEIPIAQWLTGPLRERLEAAIDPVRLARQGLFNPEPPRRWLADLTRNRRDMSEPLWTLLAFQEWAERQEAVG